MLTAERSTQKIIQTFAHTKTQAVLVPLVSVCMVLYDTKDGVGIVYVLNINDESACVYTTSLSSGSMNLA